MDLKNRLMITLCIVALIATAIFASFGRNLFSMNIPSVSLPSLSQLDGDQSGDASDSLAPNQLPTVAVTVDTVQAVVASMERSTSYYRELSIALYWGDEEDFSTTAVSVWQSGDWCAVQRTLPSGVLRHDLVGPETAYYWYEGDSRYLSTPVDDYYGDLTQGIPTYETILLLNTSDITSATYDSYEGSPCIYMEAEVSGRLERYWISTETGLLTAAEISQDGDPIYRMAALPTYQSPCPADAPLALPDGTTTDQL